MPDIMCWKTKERSWDDNSLLTKVVIDGDYFYVPTSKEEIERSKYNEERIPLLWNLEDHLLEIQNNIKNLSKSETNLKEII